MTAYIFFAEQGSGMLNGQVQSTWAAVKASTTGAGANFPEGDPNDQRGNRPTAKGTLYGPGTSVINIGGNLQYSATEGILSFDTSSLPDDCVIYDAGLQFYAQGGVPANGDYGAYELRATPAVAIPLVAAGWRAPNTVASDALLASYSPPPSGADGKVRFVGSDALDAYVSKTGKTQFRIMDSRIYGASAPAVGTVPQSSGYLTSFNYTDNTDFRPRLVVRATQASTLGNALGGSITLADGTTVSLRTTASNTAAQPAISVGYSKLTDGAAWTSISAITLGTSGFATAGGPLGFAIVTDPVGNLYVIGLKNGTTGTLLVQKFTRSGPTTFVWSAGPLREQALFTGGGALLSFAAQYVPTSPGSIFVIMTRRAGNAPDSAPTYATLNLAYIEDGASGGSMVLTSGSPAWLTNELPAKPAVSTLIDVTPTTYGATSFVVVAGCVAVVDIAAQGVVTPRLSRATVSELYYGEMVRVVPISASTFAVVGVHGYQKDLALTTQDLPVEFYRIGTDSLVIIGTGTIPRTALDAGAVYGLGWDAIFEGAKGAVGVYYVSATSTRQVERVDLYPDVYTPSTPAVISTVAGTAALASRGLRTPTGVVDERHVLIEVGNANPLVSAVFDNSANQIPSAPILTTRNPFDAALAATFSWQFRDPNARDTQTAYQLTILRTSDNVTVFDSGKVTSTASQHVLAANTLANGQAYQWRVRTYDTLGSLGSFSNYDAFSTTATGTLTITAPAADYPTLVSSSVPVAWTFSQAQGGVQNARRVRIIRQADSVVVGDTTMASTTSQTFTVTGLQSQVTYIIEVSITASTGGVATASRLVRPDFTSPMTPGLSFSPGDAWVDVAVYNPLPDGDRPEVVTNAIYKKETGTPDSFVKVAALPNGGSFRDFAVKSGTSYDYMVKGITAGGAEASSVAYPVTAPSIRGAWVHDPRQPAASLRNFLYENSKRSESIDTPATEFRFVGRAFPVYEFGVEENVSISFDVTIPYGDDYEAGLAYWRGLKRSRKVACFRDNRARLIFGFISSELSIADADHGVIISGTFTRADYTEEIA